MKIDDITVCYGTQTVLSHFSLCLPQSGVVALMGPSLSLIHISHGYDANC